MQIRCLSVGDEDAAERACRAFGAVGELDVVAFLARPEAVVLVAEDGADIVGWAYGHELVHPEGERTMLLYSLDVVEGARRRGIGTALVEAFVAHARAIACTEVWVLTDDVNEAAIATYRATGGERDPVDPVMFAWKLAGGRLS